MKTGGLDRMIGHKFANEAELLAEIEARGGLLVARSHFELDAVDAGKRVRYQLATDDAGGIEVTRRVYG